MTIDWFSFAAGFMAGTIFLKLVLVFDSITNGCPECTDDCQQGRKCPRRINGKD